MLWRASAIQDEKTTQIIEEIPAPLIKYLVFEGGGIRGIAYAGVIEELERASILSTVEHVAGSSIGSVAALLIALGCTSHEINELLGNLQFEPFLEGEKPWKITPEVISKGKQWLSILKTDCYSISSGKLFLEWIEKIVAKKLGNKNATFADLAKLANENGEKYKFLSVTGSNLSKNRIEVFNHETTPTMSIAQAIRISASFPGVFKPVELKSLEEVTIAKETDQGIVIEKKMEEVVNVYVDGGLMNNLPSFIFADEEKLPERLGFTKKGSNAAVVNVKVDTDEEMRQVLWHSSQPKPIKGIKDFSKALFDGAQSRDTDIYEQYSTNTIQVYDCDIDTLKFNITEIEKKKLIASGRNAALQWLQAHVSEAYKINVYDDEMDWLAKKKIEEIAYIKSAYREKLRNEINSLKRNANLPSSNDTKNLIQELEAKIVWFENYLRYRFDQLLNQKQSKFAVTAHVDLEPVKPRQLSDDYIKIDMLNRLAAAEKEITFLEQKIKDVTLKIEINRLNDHLHNLMVFDFVVYLTKLYDRLKWLKSTQADLLTKTRQAVNHANHVKWSTKERLLFHSQIKARLSKKDIALSPHANLISFLDRHLYRGYATYQTEEGAKGSLDLRNIEDLKIYVMACFIYLKFTNSNDALVKDLESIYKNLFPSGNIPVNLIELGNLLNQKNVELLISAYRIEGLIKNFMRVDKFKNKSALIDLDYIFTSLAPSTDKNKKIFTRNKKQEYKEDPNDFELDLLYKPFSHEYAENKFSIFHKQGDMAATDLYEHGPEMRPHAEENKNKIPKCLKRLESN